MATDWMKLSLHYDLLSHRHSSVLHPDITQLKLTTWRISPSLPISSNKPGDNCLYNYKWGKFQLCAASKDLPLSTTSLSMVLAFLLHLKQQGLSISFLKVYLAAIVAYQQHDHSFSHLFKHQTIKFLKGLPNAYRDVRLLHNFWSLSLVLSHLTKKPFELLAMTDVRLLTFKTALLVTLTSACQAAEPTAFHCGSPYVIFF